MLVEAVMSTDIVSCDYDASLQDAVVELLEAGVGSVIVERDGDPIGIVTETDALVAGAATEHPFVDIPVEDVLSHPLITVAGDTTLRDAVDLMTANDVKKLPVVEGMALRGIVTFTDIAVHHEDVIHEIYALERQRRRWEARKADIDEFGGTVRREEE